MKLFDTIRLTKPKRNKFDLSHGKNLSFNMGDLVPTFITEVLPGDSFRVNSEIMMRLAPMLAPVMWRCNVYTHYFFVPNRLIWSEWEDFITGGKEGTLMPVSPYMIISESTKHYVAQGTLGDYLGTPDMTSQTLGNPINISALPFRAYQLIFNEYYRDQNLSDEVEIQFGSGAISNQEILCTMRKRAWEKDYLTSALPWAQRGPEVLMPVEGSGHVTYLDESGVLTSAGGGTTSGDLLGIAPGSTLMVNKTGAGANGTPGRIENIDEVFLENATTTINELRRSSRLQEWLEKNARGGARYIEQILAHFGIRSSDARLQRPEYLGGGMQPIVMSEVLSTVDDTAGGLPQGTMAGHGISVGNTNRFKKSFEEHGFVIGITSVLPKTGYQQGLKRMFSRFDKFDYAWPEFANIGEQEIKNKEVFVKTDTPTRADETWGYQSRYAEYKYEPNTVHGDMRGNLAYWGMQRIFTDLPPLNENFITADPTHRIFAIEDEAEHKLWCQIYHHVSALRPLPYFNTPKL